MVVGLSTLDMLGTMPVFYMLSIILFPHNSCEVLFPSFCRWRNGGLGRWSQRIVKGGSQDSKPHLSDIKAHVLLYFCAADIRWSVIDRYLKGKNKHGKSQHLCPLNFPLWNVTIGKQSQILKSILLLSYNPSRVQSMDSSMGSDAMS